MRNRISEVIVNMRIVGVTPFQKSKIFFFFLFGKIKSHSFFTFLFLFVFPFGLSLENEIKRKFENKMQQRKMK